MTQRFGPSHHPGFLVNQSTRTPAQFVHALPCASSLSASASADAHSSTSGGTSGGTSGSPNGTTSGCGGSIDAAGAVAGWKLSAPTGSHGLRSHRATTLCGTCRCRRRSARPCASPAPNASQLFAYDEASGRSALRWHRITRATSTAASMSAARAARACSSPSATQPNDAFTFDAKTGEWADRGDSYPYPAVYGAGTP